MRIRRRVITSYSIHYTKLYEAKPTTRFVVPYLTLVGKLKEEALKLDVVYVITSYSIHYTKLYEGEWKRAPFTGYELKGKTVGVVGIGKVGGRVALRCKAFESEVIACDPYVSEKRAEDLGVKLVPLDDIVRYADT